VPYPENDPETGAVVITLAALAFVGFLIAVVVLAWWLA
jgi:hypothetical protein